MSKYSQEIIDYIYNEEEGEEDDLCISIEGFHGSEQSGFYKETVRSPMLKEKQISVDPISLKQSTRYEGPPMLPPNIVASFTSAPGLYPPPLPPSKHKSVISASLPSSATASPRSSGLSQTKNAKKGRSQAIQASLGLSRFATESLLLRSKSCGEGRASSPSDEFDLFSGKLSSSPPKHDVAEEDDGYYREYKRDDVGGIGKKVISRVDKREIEEEEDGYYQEYKRDINGVSGKKVRETTNTGRYKDEIDIFKCGKCLFLPAFGKGKPVRARKLEEGDHHQPVVVVVAAAEEERNVISRSVSLEKFECGSWTSSAIMNEDADNDDRESMHNLYFDLPLELIRNCGNDANSPVTTAFLFDSGRSGGALNNKSSSSSSRTETSRNPRESSRYVRISSTGSSGGSCITPRLRKARDDFNAFLQAQNA